MKKLTVIILTMAVLLSACSNEIADNNEGTTTPIEDTATASNKNTKTSEEVALEYITALYKGDYDTLMNYNIVDVDSLIRYEATNRRIEWGDELSEELDEIPDFKTIFEHLTESDELHSIFSYLVAVGLLSATSTSEGFDSLDDFAEYYDISDDINETINDVVYIDDIKVSNVINVSESGIEALQRLEQSNSDLRESEWFEIISEMAGLDKENVEIFIQSSQQGEAIKSEYMMAMELWYLCSLINAGVIEKEKLSSLNEITAVSYVQIKLSTVNEKPTKGGVSFAEGLRYISEILCLEINGRWMVFDYYIYSLLTDLYNEYTAQIEQEKMSDRIGASIDINDPVFNSIREQPQPLPDYLELFRQNNDMIGYIKIGNTKIDYPVLQTENNTFYLEHDFYGNPSRGGAIFADYRNRFESINLSDNTILYGHNIATGNMFSALTNYYNNIDFFNDNPRIFFDTLFEKAEWKVFAVVLFNTGETFEWWNTIDFSNESEFNSFISTVTSKSIWHTDVDIQYSDSILSLATPYSDGRLVVFARRARAGES